MLKNWFKSHPRETKIVIAALLAEAAAFLFLYFITAAQGLDLEALTGDSHGYKFLAQNLIENRVFSLSPSPPFFPESFRAPGYPLFLAFLFFFTRSWLAILIIQGLLLSFLPLLLYLVGKRFNERAAFVASLVFVFEPVRLFLSNTLLSDAFFSLLFFASTFFLLKFLELNNYRETLLSGLLLGLAVLVRPIAIFLPLIFLGFIFWKIQDKKIFFKMTLIFLAGFLLFVFPWSLRNKIIFNSWQISAVGNYNFAYYNATQFRHYKTGEPLEKIVGEFNDRQKGVGELEALSLARTAVFNEFSQEIIGQDPVGYLKFHLLKTVPFFLTDGLRDIVRSLNLLSDSPPNLSSLISKGSWSEVSNFIKGGGVALLLFVLGFGFWLLVSSLAFVCLFWYFGKKSEIRPQLIFFTTLILYFALLTGPVSNARYRMPVAGFLIFLAALTVFRNKNESNNFSRR